MIFFHIAQGYRTPPQGTNNEYVCTYFIIDNYDIILYQVIYRLKLQDVLSNEHKTSDGSGGSYSAVRLDHFVAEDYSQPSWYLER